MNALMVLRVALKALRINKLRTLLTMLGMIIGVAAVIAMISIGSGAQERVREQLRNLGSNLILVLPGSTTASGVRLGWGAAQTLTEEDARAIALEVEGVVVAAPSVRGTGQVVAGSANWSTQFFGTTNDYLVARDWPIASGRAFEDGEIAGAATTTPSISSAMARASSSVSVCAAPMPSRTPLAVVEPGSTRIRFEPRFFSWSRTRSCAPAPIEIIAITAATPMIMPSIVSAVRSLFTRSAFSATRSTISAFTRPPPSPRPRGGRGRRPHRAAAGARRCARGRRGS